MSGSGGGRDDYQTSNAVGFGKPTSTGGSGGGGGGGDADPCAIEQTAPINSPSPAVVPGLAIGDVLDVGLAGTPPRSILEVRTATGQVAGSLTHVGHLALIRCIQQGHAYQAEVLQRNGGTVIVQISRT